MTRLEKNKAKKMMVTSSIIGYTSLIIMITMFIMSFMKLSFVKEYSTVYYSTMFVLMVIFMVMGFFIPAMNDMKIRQYKHDLFNIKDHNNLVRGIWDVKNKNLQKASDIHKTLKSEIRQTLLFGLIYGTCLCSDNEDLYNDAINQLENFKQK